MMWGSPAMPWKSPPRSNPQSLTDRSWSINTSAPSPLQQDNSEVHVLHHFPVFTVGLSSDHPSGKWLDGASVIGCIPVHTPQLVLPRLTFQIHHLPSNPYLLIGKPTLEYMAWPTRSFHLQELVCSSNSILHLFINSPTPCTKYPYSPELKLSHQTARPEYGLPGSCVPRERD